VSSPAAINTVDVSGKSAEMALAAAFIAWMSGRLGLQVSGELTTHPTQKKTPPVILGPKSQALIRRMGLDERDLVKTCAGTFCIGTYITRRDDRTPFFFPYLTKIESYRGIGFHQIYGKAKHAGYVRPYASHFAPYHMADAKSFSHPSGNDAFQYYLVLDYDLFQNYMSRAAKHYGYVAKTSDPVDLKIVSELKDTPYIVESQEAYDTPMPTTSTLDIKDHTITHRSFSQINKSVTVYDLAEMCLYSQSETPGAWHGERLDLARLTTNILPFDQCYMDSVSHGLMSLLDLWPATSDMAVNRREFNRRTGLFRDRCEDFQSALRLASKPSNIDSVSSELSWKWTTFQSRGRLKTLDFEPITTSEWVAYLLALGVEPDRLDPLTGNVSKSEIDKYLSESHTAALEHSKSMVSQNDYLSRANAIFIQTAHAR